MLGVKVAFPLSLCKQPRGDFNKPSDKLEIFLLQYSLLFIAGVKITLNTRDLQCKIIDVLKLYNPSKHT